MPKSELDFTENKTESESDSESDEDDLEENEDFKREQQEHLDKLIKKLNNEGVGFLYQRCYFNIFIDWYKYRKRAVWHNA